MAHLTLTGVSDDGKRLLLVGDGGEEFSVDIDADLRAALRTDPPTPRPAPTPVETPMDSTLRPRDIQARIRAGATPEEVAAAGNMPLERVLPYAGPVLAEREHIADRAQRASVRRLHGDPGSGRVLGEAVTGHLRAANVDPDVVEWDAWRREDGRWVVAGGFSTPARSGRAHFLFDVPGNYVTAEDDDAAWLMGESEPDLAEAAEGSPAAGGRDDLRRARQRRLSSVPDEQLSLDDALPLDDDPGDDSQDQQDHPEEQEEPAAVVDEEPPPPPVRRPVKKSRGRASVPSWDEIMFGGGKPD